MTRNAIPIVFTAPRICQCDDCAALPNDMVRAFAQTIRVQHAAAPCDQDDCETCYDLALHRRLPNQPYGYSPTEISTALGHHHGGDGK